MDNSHLTPEADKKIKRFRQIPLRFLLPNMVTLLALCSGVTALRLGIEGRMELAVSALIVSILLDAIDGRLARYLKGTSRFGAELDSLADFVNFGVAPAMLIYVWSLNALKTKGWIVALVFAMCCALRLARFNVAQDEEKPRWAANYFTGIPAPAGAGLALAPLYLGFLGVIYDGHAYAGLIAGYIVILALLLVSRVPTFSGKGIKISRDMAVPVLGGATFIVICLVAYPWETLTLFCVCYLMLIPFSWMAYRRNARKIF